MVPTEGLSKEEADERVAVAKAWLEFWEVFTTATNEAPERQVDLIDAHSVAPMNDLWRLILSDSREENVGTYGTVGHRLFWPIQVPDPNISIIGDCRDSTEFGTFDLKSGKQKTHGSERSDTRGVFRLQDDGKWKLSELQYLADSKC